MVNHIVWCIPNSQLAISGYLIGYSPSVGMKLEWGELSEYSSSTSYYIAVKRVYSAGSETSANAIVSIHASLSSMEIRYLVTNLLRFFPYMFGKHMPNAFTTPYIDASSGCDPWVVSGGRHYISFSMANLNVSSTSWELWSSRRRSSGMLPTACLIKWFCDQSLNNTLSIQPLLLSPNWVPGNFALCPSVI